MVIKIIMTTKLLEINLLKPQQLVIIYFIMVLRVVNLTTIICLINVTTMVRLSFKPGYYLIVNLLLMFSQTQIFSPTYDMRTEQYLFIVMQVQPRLI